MYFDSSILSWSGFLTILHDLVAVSLSCWLSNWPISSLFLTMSKTVYRPIPYSFSNAVLKRLHSNFFIFLSFFFYCLRNAHTFRRHSEWQDKLKKNEKKLLQYSKLYGLSENLYLYTTEYVRNETGKDHTSEHSDGLNEDPTLRRAERKKSVKWAWPILLAPH